MPKQLTKEQERVLAVMDDVGPVKLVPLLQRLGKGVDRMSRRNLMRQMHYLEQAGLLTCFYVSKGWSVELETDNGQA